MTVVLAPEKLTNGLMLKVVVSGTPFFRCSFRKGGDPISECVSQIKSSNLATLFPESYNQIVETAESLVANECRLA